MDFNVRLLGTTLAMFTLISSLEGCANSYQIPENGQGTSVITGSIFGKSHPDEPLIKLTPDSIDDEPLLNTRPVTQILVESGLHSFKFTLAREVVDSFSWDANLRSIDAALLPDKTYRLTGEIVIGNAIKYWIEETNTGEIVSKVHYDPEILKEELQAIESEHISDPEDCARIEVSAKGIFANKKTLRPGRACFGLIENRALNQDEVTLYFLLSFFSGQPAMGLSAEYAYRSYENICLDVKAGHVYEFKGSNRDPETQKLYLGKENWFELWDVTDDKLLEKYEKYELKVKVSEFE